MADEQSKLIKILHKVAKENNFNDYELTIKPISTGGANYTSHLYTANLNFKNETINIFAKIAATGEKMRSQTPMKIYDTERYFYTKLAKIYRGIEEKNHIEDENKLKFPKFYGYCDNLYEETIVMEDLQAKGFGNHDRMRSVDWDYAAGAMKEMAKLHALSIAYKRQDPESFEADADILKLDWSQGELMQGFWDTQIKLAMNVVSDQNKEKVAKFFQSGILEMDSYKQYLEPKKLGVFIHGDYRPSNLLHRKREDESVEVIPVDFQTLQYGTPVLDFHYFLITGTDEEFRKKHYEDLLDCYHSEFTDAVIRLGIDPDVYTKEDFCEEVKEKMPFSLATAIFLLPIVTVEAENAPKVDENMDFNSFTIQNTSSLFSERLNGVVNDLVKWGAL